MLVRVKIQIGCMKAADGGLLSGVTGRSDMVFYVSGSSNYYVYSEQTYNGNAPNGAAYNTHPVLNLSSTVNIIGGNGSQNNPYVIE